MTKGQLLYLLIVMSCIFASQIVNRLDQKAAIYDKNSLDSVNGKKIEGQEGENEGLIARKHRITNSYIIKRDFDDINELEKETILKERVQSCSDDFENRKSSQFHLFRELNSTVNADSEYSLKNYFKIGELFGRYSSDKDNTIECISNIFKQYKSISYIRPEFVEVFYAKLNTLQNTRLNYVNQIDSIFSNYSESKFNANQDYRERFQEIMRLLYIAHNS
ncbi:hypothetical protein BB561_001100 [Smittium simulii]|uniref:Uncharacterized protein n=1 Tax=Smittium simulii TaxID=133385 RepID=A0A2T9YW28_9FUNG|nr:hypothetical protein BB561_001100 [Smittium simulii]